MFTARFCNRNASCVVPMCPRPWIWSGSYLTESTQSNTPAISLTSDHGHHWPRQFPQRVQQDARMLAHRSIALSRGIDHNGFERRRIAEVHEADPAFYIVQIHNLAFGQPAVAAADVGVVGIGVDAFGGPLN